MLGILAHSLMTATRQERREDRRMRDEDALFLKALRARRAAGGRDD